MAALVKAFFAALHHLVCHRELHAAVAKMTLLDRLAFTVLHALDRTGLWHRLPVFFGMLYMGARRRLYQKYGMSHVGPAPAAEPVFNVGDYPHRTADGKFNDPLDDCIGSRGTLFGRNIPPVDQTHKLMKPNPMVVATKLLARRKFVDTGKQFNMIAASWVQLMVHDWMDHLEDTQQIEVVAAAEVAEGCPLKSFKFLKTKQVPSGCKGVDTAGVNIRTPWWDSSVLYGSDQKTLNKVRTFKDGKLKISQDGLLVHDDNGVAVSGDVRNSWAGLSVLQALFIKEHNAICEALKDEYPELEDEELYHRARLVTSAVIAKIHTIDWTVELLKRDFLVAAMRHSWFGFIGKKLKRKFGHVGKGFLIGGIVGMKKPVNHGIPFSLTEEFVSVYRMHQLLPDNFILRNISAPPGPNKSLPPIKEVPMPDMIGLKGEKTLSELGFTKVLVSMGHQASGAMELWNYPMWLRDLVPQNEDGTDRTDHIDLAALDVYRDRERKVARYNEFRRGMLLVPISKWEDLTEDEEAIATLREVYGEDVEEMDLQVGLVAEKKVKGFAIGGTALAIFTLMSARRLETDRFFTSHFNEETYTKRGLEWVHDTDTLKDVIDRHCPKMSQKWMSAGSAFSVWDSPPPEHNWVPLHLRLRG